MRFKKQQEPNSNWRQKDKVPVVVYTAAGDPVHCSVFCGEDEVVSDVINQAQPFLLVETHAGAVSMVKKTQIKKVVPEATQSLVFMMASEEGEHIAITFLDGTYSEGTIYLPPGMRASDIANSSTPFFLYRPDDGAPEYVCEFNIQQIVINPRMN